MRVLVIDNYDSFVFNLVQYLGQLGVECDVRRNDEITVAEVAGRRRRHPAVARAGHPGPGRHHAWTSSASTRASCRSSACAWATRRSAKSSGRQ